MVLIVTLIILAVAFVVLRAASRTSGRKVAYAILAFAAFAGAIAQAVVIYVV